MNNVLLLTIAVIATGLFGFAFLLLLGLFLSEVATALIKLDKLEGFIKDRSG